MYPSTSLYYEIKLCWKYNKMIVDWLKLDSYYISLEQFFLKKNNAVLCNRLAVLGSLKRMHPSWYDYIFQRME